MILIGVFYVFPPVFGVMGRNLLPELYNGVGAKGTDKVVLELPRLLNQNAGGSSREGGEGSEVGEEGDESCFTSRPSLPSPTSREIFSACLPMDAAAALAALVVSGPKGESQVESAGALAGRFSRR